MDIYDIRNKLINGENLSNINLRVTYYARVSTDHIEQLSSLKNQYDFFENMIKTNTNWTYIPGYIDKGISGTTSNREQFINMIEDSEKDKFDLIITKEISRFSRNTLDSIKYTRKLLDNGVAVLFLNDNINTFLPDSELRLSIMASLAQDEIRRLSERVKFGMKESIKNGTILGNNMLYGYYKDKVSGNLLVIEKERTIVKKIFYLYTIENFSINKIATYLNQNKIPTKTNKQWTITTIKRILKNPKYIGYYCGGKSERINYITKKIKYKPQEQWIIYEDINKIPPIIDKKIFHLAQEKLNKNMITIHKQTYPFSNKIYCLKDNSLYYPRKNYKNTITWLCSNYLNNKKEKCNTANIKNNELLYMFIDILKELKININKIKEILYKNYQHYVPINTMFIYNKLIDELIIKITVDKNIVININWYLNIKSNIKYNKTYTFNRNKKEINYKSLIFTK